MTVSSGFTNTERPRIAALYWEAFGAKLGRIMGPDRRALRLIARVADPDHALVFRDKSGRVQGVAGFKTAEGAFVGGDLRDFVAIYGIFSGPIRAAALSLLERDEENQRFLMDGICVAGEARGHGVGTSLLEAIAREANARGYQEVRLDVIDGNARARALYERRGFKAVGRQSTGLLAPLVGFRSSTTMVRRLK